MPIPTILSLSTIPPRFKHLRSTLHSLLHQSEPFQEIRLYIPLKYRRFPDWDGVLPQVPPGIEIHRCEADYGPATKVLPAARNLRDQDVHILFCDDDRTYNYDWHAKLRREAIAHPMTCIAALGANLEDIDKTRMPVDRVPRGRCDPKNLAYKVKRFLSLGLVRPQLPIQEGYIDQFHGCGGVLVKPEWLPDAAYDIPDVIWTVDDVWLSGHLEYTGIAIWICEGLNPGYSSANWFEPLRKHEEAGHGRQSANKLATEYFRSRYGIWPTSAPP